MTTKLLIAGGLAALLSGLTGASWHLAGSGAGLSEDPAQEVSLRRGSAVRHGVIVGGGPHAGK